MHSEFTQVIDLQKWRHWNVWWWRRAGTGFVDKMFFSIGLRAFVSFLYVFVFVCVCVCLLLFCFCLFIFVSVYFCACVFCLFMSAKLRCVFSTDPGSRVLSSDNSFHLTFFAHWAPLMKYHQYHHCKQSVLRNSINLKGFLKWILVSICGQKA